MKIAVLMILSLVTTALSIPSLAHDPKEHQDQGTAAPDCSKMKDMDVSKMNMNDPVMKALYAKCKKQMEHQKTEHDHMTSVPGTDKAAAQTPVGAAQKPVASTMDCSKMKGMDMSKMGMNDSAMKAMQEKCMKQMNQGAKHDHAAHESGPGKKPAPASIENTK